MFRKMKEKKGFTLIELMIVIAILGVLAAVAIPQYMNYVAASKGRAVKSNYDSALKMVKAEFSKKTADLPPTTNIITPLNDTTGKNNKNPYNPTTEQAYTSGGPNLGQVYVSTVDFAALAAGSTVTVKGLWMEGATATSVQATMTYQ